MREVVVSVIIPSFNSQHTIEKCLHALEKQKCPHNFEIIVVDSSQDSTSKIILQKFPNISHYSFSERKYPGDARNFGVTKANGQIFAFTDSDCIVDQDWIEKIIEAHKNPSPLIGGIIDNGNPESYVGWGHYFSEFSQWMPQTTPGNIEEVPAGCLSIKRWAFKKYGPFPEGTYSEDTLFNWRLSESQEKPLFIPGIKVRHINQANFFKLLKKQAIHGKFFAIVRISTKNFSVFRRSVFVIFSPLLPFVLFYRICKRMTQNKTYAKQFIIASPIVFFSLISWSWGEFCGYLSKTRQF